MNFNHLVSDRESKITCGRNHCGASKWVPVSEGEASAGKNISVQMLCENCKARTHVFLHFEEYKTHEKLIIQEVNRDKTSK